MRVTVKYFLLLTRIRYFGHGNIIKYSGRPFLTDVDKAALIENGGEWHDGVWKGAKASRWRMTDEAVKMMDDAIIDNINRMVGPNDTLWHLGDFALPGRNFYYENCRKYRERIRCRNIHYIFGNHDRREIAPLFTRSYDLYDAEINGRGFVLCHYALAVWNRSHHGAICLYGHSHSSAEKWLEQAMPGRRSMDVGVDNAYKIFGEFRPFTFDEIISLVGNRSGTSIDHHIGSNAPIEADGT